MKTPLKTKIAFWWWKNFRFRQPVNIIQKISDQGDGVNSLLIILPQDRTHLSIALHFIKTIIARGHENVLKKIIGLEEHEGIIEQEILKKIELINSNDINYFGLLTPDALKRLTKGKFNGIINLDPEMNPISTQIVSSFNTEIRIGFSSDNVKDIYNISIENDYGNNYVEKGYKYILEVLGL